MVTTAILTKQGQLHGWGLHKASPGDSFVFVYLFLTGISFTAVVQASLSSSFGQKRGESFLVAFLSIPTHLGCPKT